MAEKRETDKIFSLENFEIEVCKKLDIYFDFLKQAHVGNLDVRRERMLKKINEISREISGLELYASSLSWLRKYFSDIMFYEILETDSNENILRNLEVLCNKK